MTPAPRKSRDGGDTGDPPALRPWAAFSAVILGFFILMVDTNIVSIANPAIMRGLGADINTVIWVTSAYLLAFAVPLLVAGRLGDRFGIKRVYISGLVIFTAASAWAGMAGSIELLIAARAVQGVGGALMSPQSMAVITRVFPPTGRGQAMALWGATAGVAMFVGPVLGGLLVDSVGWEWIFFVNVPLGILGLYLAWKFLPDLATRKHRFDFLGVFLSGVGTFLVVFGIEEGGRYNWGTITGPISIPGIIGLGVVTLLLFVRWQAVNKGEPLVPLALFRDRNFSVGNLTITIMGFAVAAQSIPMAYFLQLSLGMTPTQAGLIQLPMAAMSLICSPVVGKLLDTKNPRTFAVLGLLIQALTLVGGWQLYSKGADAPLWGILVISAAIGFAGAGIWGPLGNITTRNLAPSLAGAGAGVYNSTRQFGSVVGAAAIAAMIQSRLLVNLGFDLSDSSSAVAGTLGGVPESMVGGFSQAMGEVLLLPAAASFVAALVALFLEKPQAEKEAAKWIAPKIAH